MVDTKLHENDKIFILDVVAPRRPAAHARPAARLIRVTPTGVEFIGAVAVGDGVDCAVGEFGALVVEGGGVRQHRLEGGEVDFVGDRCVVDGVENCGVLDFEDAIHREVGVVAARVREDRFLRYVAVAVRVGGRVDGHGVGFGVNEAVRVAVYCGVDAQAEEVLMVGGEDAWVYD